MTVVDIVSDESNPLEERDQPFYDAVKKQFGDQCTEDLAIRVTRAFHHFKAHRMEVTLAEAKKILEWRAKLNADTILTRELDQSRTYFDCWPGMIYGEDNDGHLVAVDRVNEIDVDAFHKNFSSVETLLPHRLQYMERIQWEKAAISKRLGRRVYKHICIVDLKGLGLKHVSRSVINQLKPIFDIGQVYYPETLHRLYLINAPFIFHGAWKIISTFVEPETRAKIQVLKEGEKFLDIAQKHGIPLESIPACLGGKHPGRSMNSTFKPSVADTPLPVPTPSETPAPSTTS
ncbi:hypothetical protein Poli38472_001348 [Pythium oligandrum]|uniref:CRAL-TRIO domain-containing protein n=1 Tax=Pythium oligandrum TaxID=41045 RepID=A0A8K1CUP1_PYTOL|nr:hypothetical protein Poli38472_001348 [Pythium oligandrum]|eukprot:TMW69192.1 hypothetical protein Poli38472_001348 [Pythium oligandrum]